MLFKNNLILGLLSDCFSHWFVNYAVSGATIGLVAAYFLTQKLGWDQQTWYWTLTTIGAIVGIKHDYDENSNTVNTLQMLGYLCFVVFLSGGAVLMVLSYVGPSLTE